MNRYFSIRIKTINDTTNDIKFFNRIGTHTISIGLMNGGVFVQFFHGRLIGLSTSIRFRIFLIRIQNGNDNELGCFISAFNVPIELYHLLNKL